MRKNFPFYFCNLTPVHAHLVRDYYWEAMKLTKINHDLMLSKEKHQAFELGFPSMPIGSRPEKIILSLRNNTKDTKQFTLKRIKICDCALEERQIGLNRFKLGYNCPHRDLLEILPLSGTIPGDEIFALKVNLNFTLIGNTPLAYEMYVDDFTVRFNFGINIVEFDPPSYILTRKLKPVGAAVLPAIVQPIWIFNPHHIPLTFYFDTEEEDILILSKHVTIEPLTVAPLLVQYLPRERGDAKLTFQICFLGIKNEFTIKGKALLIKPVLPVQVAPHVDISHPEIPFIVTKNHVKIDLPPGEDSCLAVAVHNNYTENLEFRWLRCGVENFFNIKVSPSKFCSKPGHTTICYLEAKVGKTTATFPRVPLICEAYRRENILENAFQDGDNEGENSIYNDCNEDPETRIYSENLFITKVVVDISLRINGIPNVEVPTAADDVFLENNPIQLPSNFDLFNFEKILWEFLFNQHFLNIVLNREDVSISYADLDKKGAHVRKIREYSTGELKKEVTKEILRSLLQHAVTDMSKHWRFIPFDYAEP